MQSSYPRGHQPGHPPPPAVQNPPGGLEGAAFPGRGSPLLSPDFRGIPVRTAGRQGLLAQAANEFELLSRLHATPRGEVLGIRTEREIR